MIQKAASGPLFYARKTGHQHMVGLSGGEIESISASLCYLPRHRKLNPSTREQID